MARKGSRKVRTGCLTCKVRKVKCDEAKPVCQRCSSTGRKCDGYPTPPSSPEPGALWHRPRHVFQGFDNAGVSRSLQYFTEVVGPFMSGSADPYFWTHLVMQFSHFEPAVRHSLVAVSSLAEQEARRARWVDEAGSLSGQMEGQTPQPKLTRNRFAIAHYNAAISELKTVTNEPLVLLVNILFVCIEFLQQNREAATTHARHGIQLLQRAEKQFPWLREHLSPIFRRMRVFPYFFGESTPADFPSLAGSEEDMPDTFHDLKEAQLYIDGLMSRTVTLAERGTFHVLKGLGHLPDFIPPEYANEKKQLKELLRKWGQAFSELKRGGANLEPSRAKNLWSLMLEFTVIQAWVDGAFWAEETVFDRWIDSFRQCIDEIEAGLAYQQAVDKSDTPSPRDFFTFEMGFTAPIFFMITKCRCLETRLRALRLMGRLARRRENLWQLSVFHSCARRVIEKEHGILLDQQGHIVRDNPAVTLPQDEHRVRATSSAWEGVEEINEETGRPFFRRKVTFYKRTAEGVLYTEEEYLIDTDLDELRTMDEISGSPPVLADLFETADAVDTLFPYGDFQSGIEGATTVLQDGEYIPV